MTQPGTEAQPLRVAIIGAGPSGFYAAEHLLSHPEIVVEVDLIDRLPTPYGLVRYGVAPDHQKIKSVTAAYDKTAANPRFRFFGNVEFGKHLTREDLAAHYHQILFTTGAQTDRRIGIPGEDLAGSYPATEFVAWYNGIPITSTMSSICSRKPRRSSASATSQWTSPASSSVHRRSWPGRTSPTMRWRRCGRAG